MSADAGAVPAPGSDAARYRVDPTCGCGHLESEHDDRVECSKCDCQKFISERRQIQQTERDLSRALSTCTMFPGSAEKRFIRDIVSANEITERQLRYLYFIAHRYRRQMSAGEMTRRIWRGTFTGSIDRWSELDDLHMRPRTGAGGAADADADAE